jgi:hypothetical protein
MIPIMNTSDETTASGAVVLWSERSDEDLHNRVVPVRYACCGSKHIRSIYSLNRFRKGAPVKCIDCVTAVKQVPDERPTCPRCGTYPVQRNWRGPTHQPFRGLCWSCSAPAAADPEARHQRYLRWREKMYQAEAAAMAENEGRTMAQREREHWEDVQREASIA